MIKFPIVHVESCALCPSHEPLRESHIIPHFVFDWLLESSATGYMRLGIAPNVRVQDGAKQHLLCDDCEKRLSRWETEVAQALFRRAVFAAVDGSSTRSRAYESRASAFLRPPE